MVLINVTVHPFLIVYLRTFLRLFLGYIGRKLASAGVQQGDPLGLLLLALVFVQFLNSNPLDEACLLSLWYLDDGTLYGFNLPFTLYFLALLSLGTILVCISIYLSVNCTGLVVIALILVFLPLSSTLIRKVVIWSFLGRLYGALLNSMTPFFFPDG